MPRPKGSKNKPKEVAAPDQPKRGRGRPPGSKSTYKRHLGSNPPGRPKGWSPLPPEEQAKRAEEKAEKKAEKEARRKELVIQHAADLMAADQAAEEMAENDPQTRAVRARYKIDKKKMQTHNQYIMAIATLPMIDSLNPSEVLERVQYYLEIASAAGQRIVFETCALALGISRYTLVNRINGKTRLTQEQRNVYTWLAGILDAATAEYAHAGEASPVSTIFFAKNNQGYTNDEPQLNAETADNSTEQSNEEIAAKYSDLPI